jgi:DNA-binding NtrC family response regulator
MKVVQSIPPLSMAVIDDNLDNLELMSEVLHAEKIQVHYFQDPAEGLAFTRAHRPQIVMTDLVMPNLDGMQILDEIIAFDPTIDVVLMTAYYSTESAIAAIRHGATDYLEKPLSIESLRSRIGKLAALHRARLQALSADALKFEAHSFEGMLGNSPQMWQLFSQIQRIAPHFRTLLIHGATGTGKELVAQALHHLNGAQGPFVPLNCSAVVETLFESELFGHVKGAFTGATSNKTGLMEHAHQGTLFLDEIGDMPLTTQAKLLRALQNQEVQPLGSLQPKRVNVRVIAATHRDLREMIHRGQFREDLFYRLSMVEISVPTLSEREGDIPLLAKSFTEKWAKQYGRDLHGLSPKAMLLLNRHSWPGNVRELDNVIGHAAIMTAGPLIDVFDLPHYLIDTDAAQPAVGVPGLEQMEKQLLIGALKANEQNQSRAARALDISRDKLRYRMKKHGLL